MPDLAASVTASATPGKPTELGLAVVHMPAMLRGTRTRQTQKDLLDLHTLVPLDRSSCRPLSHRKAVHQRQAVIVNAAEEMTCTLATATCQTMAAKCDPGSASRYGGLLQRPAGADSQGDL